MILIVVIGCGICAVGLQRGVEKVTKVMMGLLLGVMLLLVVKSLSLDGAIKGVEFYLVPDFNLLMENGIFNAVYGAMGQAFFTLSIGMGGMAIFGSYIGREHSLTGEGLVFCARYFCCNNGRIDYFSSLYVFWGGCRKWTGISFCDTAKYF